MDERLNTIEESLAFIKKQEDVSMAKELKRLVEELLADPANKIMADQLRGYLQELSVYTFRYLNEDDILRYFVKGLENVLRNEDINFIIDSVKYFLYSYRALVDYTAVREQLLQSLYENKEALTVSPVRYKNGKEMSGSVKNWFKHYQLQFDHSKEFRIGMMEYLNRSLAIQELRPEEKEAVKNLIYLIEYLRTDVEEIFAQEADLLYDFGEEGTIGYIDGDYVELKADPLLDKVLQKINELKTTEPTDTEQAATPASVQTPQQVASDNKELVSLKAKIQLSEEEMINFRNIIAKYKALPDEDIMNYFWEGLDSYNKYLIMGALHEMIRRKLWDEIWDLPRLRLLLNDFRSRKLKDLSLDPNDKKAQLKVLLMFLLEQHLSLPQDNARKWSLYLVNYLVKNNYGEYQDLIYFDKEKARLEWEK